MLRSHCAHAIVAALTLSAVTWIASPAWAQKAQCPLDHQKLVDVLKHSVTASGGPDNGGLPVNEWAAVVNRQGIVCAVAFSGNKPTDQWLGSRAIAAEKANTVNAFGLDKYAISTANLWAPSQPGGSLYGAAASNPPVAQALYSGDPTKFGSGADPLVGKIVGGVIAFGGGLALYQDGNLVGGLGASGNTSCADHNIAWRMRQALKMDAVPNGPSPSHNDAIVYDVDSSGKSASGWGHPTCGHNGAQVAKQIGAGILNEAQGSKPPTQTTGEHPAQREPPNPAPQSNPAPQK
jgi:uncharacterized protein GlcG (DUF336 family)